MIKTLSIFLLFISSNLYAGKMSALFATSVVTRQLIVGWDWLNTNIFNTILFQIIFWVLFLVCVFLFFSWLLGDNLEDLDGNEKNQKKPNANLRFKVIIISIISTLLSTFFWYNVF
tara:strand:+ start:44 stop:391 length:348 start_codon:yes stop_codon:yes gene_type:complete